MFQERYKKFLRVGLIVVVAAALFFGGFLVSKKLAPPRLPTTTTEQIEILGGNNLDLFWQTLNLLKERYVHSERFDGKKAVYGAIKGVVRSLDDPYTEFLEPRQATILKENLSGSFSGIGIEIGIRGNVLTVIAPLADTPADRVGLKAKDRILKIDGVDTYDMSLDEAVSRIRGPQGTKVTLSIFREEWDKARDFTIVRNVIKIKGTEAKVLESNIAYIKLNNFDQSVYGNFIGHLEQLTSSGPKKYIIDLRNNPGGFLEVSVDLAGWFLDKGDLVVIEDFGGKAEQKKSYSRGPSVLAKSPVIILINEGSASASEIFAGALRDNRKVMLIGEKTFGKGSVQEGIDLPDGSILKVTIANWLTPHGTVIEGKGLEPDIAITDKKPDDGVDEQLQKAIEVIKALN